MDRSFAIRPEADRGMTEPREDEADAAVLRWHRVDPDLESYPSPAWEARNREADLVTRLELVWADDPRAFGCIHGCRSEDRSQKERACDASFPHRPDLNYIA